MISLQYHNQVLYHLTQITSAVTPRCSRFTARPKKHNNKEVSDNIEILCQESLLEAAKNCTELNLDQICIHRLEVPLRVKQSTVWDILNKISAANSTLSRDTKWNVSYVSSSTFAENKRGVPYFHLEKPIPVPAFHLSTNQTKRFLHHLCQAAPFGYNVQIRTFKTKRSIKMELERNLSLTGKFKKWLGLNSFSDSVHSEANIDKILKDETNLAKLQTILGNNNTTPDEQHRTKVAFAEGYLAASTGKTVQQPWTLIKKTNQLMTLFVCLVILVSLLANMNGSVFKLPVGHQVEVDPMDINVTFNDVKGVDDAKQELKNVVEFLKNPEKFSILGGKLPKGILLVGPPGTGKTLLARAVAGEAGVPFFHAAGPEFDEVLVGQGARRVRDLFKAAKERAPCVVFIDEIDSVGSRRTSSVLHPYANQTINQLLSEMDGFHQNEGVIVLGATNRRADLDKALLRPGRFDVEVFVKPPDYIGRKELFDLYLGKVLTRNINVEVLARRSVGFTAAAIENMVNQAALNAAIENADYVTMEHLEKARDKVILGPEGRKVNDEQGNRITAFHEGGHALVAYYTQDAKPIHKVTIIPRGQSGGHTAFLPEKDQIHTTKAELLAHLDSIMGGRAAEELMFGPDRVTTGAQSDLMAATKIAEHMVKIYGMSEKVGFRIHNADNGSGPSTNEMIDDEIRNILRESYERAKLVLKNHTKELMLVADALLKYETLDLEDVKAVINGKKLRRETTTNNVNNSTKRPILDGPENVM